MYLSDVTSSSEKIIVGDLNAPDVEWSSRSGTQSQSNPICHFVFNSNLTQLVDKPTRTRVNIVDIVITSIDFIYNLQVHKSPTLSSDHYPMKLDSFTNWSQSESINNVYDYSKADMEGLSEFLLNLDTYQMTQSLYGMLSTLTVIHLHQHLRQSIHFLPNRSTLQQLLLLLNEIVNSLPSQPFYTAAVTVTFE